MDLMTKDDRDNDRERERERILPSVTTSTLGWSSTIAATTVIFILEMHQFLWFLTLSLGEQGGFMGRVNPLTRGINTRLEDDMGGVHLILSSVIHDVEI